MSYDHAYFPTDGDAISAIVSVVVNLITSGGFALLAYVLRSWAVYAIAKRRGLRHPWMAWVPVTDLWLLGCISDQYRYVVKEQEKSRRKILLALNILTCLLTAAVSAFAVSTVVGLVNGAMTGTTEAEIFSLVTNLILGAAGFGIPLAILAITLTVFRFMALYDLYVSCVPQNATLFIVLSILFRPTEPFFLFFCKNKDEGMPPRRPEAQTFYQEDYHYQPPQEPWEQGE